MLQNYAQLIKLANVIGNLGGWEIEIGRERKEEEKYALLQVEKRFSFSRRIPECIEQGPTSLEIYWDFSRESATALKLAQPRKWKDFSVFSLTPNEISGFNRTRQRFAYFFCFLMIKMSKKSAGNCPFVLFFFGVDFLSCKINSRCVFDFLWFLVGVISWAWF